MSLHSQHHSFDIALAAKHGIERAILIHHLQHWIRVNRRRGKNIRNGKCYMYQSRADMAAHFPYMTPASVKHHLEVLVKEEVLITANFNRAKFDKTLWYAFKDEKKYGVDEESSKSFYEGGKPLTKEENLQREEENLQPIPDTKKKDTKEGDASDDASLSRHDYVNAEDRKVSEYLYKKILKLNPKHKKPNFVSWDKAVRLMRERDQRTQEEMYAVIDWVMDDAFWCKNILSTDKLRKQFDQLQLKMTEVSNRGTQEEKNRQVAKDVKNYLNSIGKNNLQIYVKKCFIGEKNEELMYDMNPAEFESILCKAYGLEKQ